MEVPTIEDCFKFRLLRKISKDIKKSSKSIEIAEQRLNDAENALKLKIWKYVLTESYMAMFHSARALLYKDGIQEKSHYAVYIYLKERYKDKVPLNIINYLNIHRGERHEAMYGLEFNPDKIDAETALNDARIFVNKIKEILR